MRSFIFSLLFLTIFYAGIPHSFANDSSYYGSGATVFPIQQSQILMEKEDIRITFSKNAQEPTRDELVADCTFTFVNQSAQPLTIQMGFPDWKIYSEDRWNNQWAIRNFSVWVDGQATMANHKEVQFEKGGNSQASVQPRRELRYPGAYTWEVKFDPHQRVIVKNTYRFFSASTMNPIESAFEKSRVLPPKQSFFWKGLKKDPNAPYDFDNHLTSFIVYITETGRAWAGPIKEAEIAIEFPKSLPHLVTASPGNYIVKNNFITWNFKNWTPTQDILVFIMRPVSQALEDDVPPIFNSVAEAKNWLRYAQGRFFDPQLIQRLRQTILMQYQSIPQDAEFEEFLNHQSIWAKLRQKPRKGMISAKDQTILQMLENFEKQLKTGN